MFGQVLEKLDAYFGRAFLLARYFPWLLAIGVNLIIGCVEFPEVRGFVVGEYTAISANAASKALDLLIALLAVWVVAYSTTPLVQFITNFLEGSSIPDWLAVWLVVTHSERRERLDEKANSRFTRRSRLPDKNSVVAQLKADRDIGTRSGAITHVDAINEAATLIKRLRKRRWMNLDIDVDRFERARSALSRALRANCAEVSELIRPGDAAQALRLDALHNEMWKIVTGYVLDIAEQREDRAYADRQRLFAEIEMEPTRLGNDAAALRSYCETRYGIDFDFFWPRFLLVAQKDDKLANTIATAKIQLDFSILALTLTATTTAAWSLVLLAWGTSLWTVFLVFVVGPAATMAWLGIVHASYSNFADLARSVVDLYRLDVLVALHRPLPLTTEAEQSAWERVARLSLLGEHGNNAALRHPAK
jgi:hypothetical protein